MGGKTIAALAAGALALGGVGVAAVATEDSTTSPDVTVQAQAAPPHPATESTGQYSATFHWGGVTEPGQTGYYVYQNGTQVADVTTPAYTFTGLDCGTTFTFGVAGHDGSGHTTPTSTTTYSTPACAGGGGGGGPTVNYFVAQTSAGSANGTSCANAAAITTLSTTTHWTAGNVIGLCGTITSESPPKHPGRIGNPITVYWEPGASISASAPTCTSGCVNINNRSYITLNGGTNGIIQTTDNGAALTFQDQDYGIQATSSDHALIENLTIKNIFVKTSGSSAPDGAGILANNATTITIDHNTMTQTGFKGIEMTGSSAQGPITISNNDMSADNWQIEVANADNLTQQPVYIFGNHIHDNAVWDDPANNYHHNGIFCFGTGTTDPQYTGGWYIYNNLFGGDPGLHTTAWIDIQDCSNDTTTYYVFNNILADTTNDWGNGYVAVQKGIDPTYNNTLQAAANGFLLNTRESGNKDLENNLSINGLTGEQTRGGCGGTPPTGFSCPIYTTLTNNIYANTQGGVSHHVRLPTQRHHLHLEQHRLDRLESLQRRDHQQLRATQLIADRHQPQPRLQLQADQRIARNRRRREPVQRL